MQKPGMFARAMQAKAEMQGTAQSSRLFAPVQTTVKPSRVVSALNRATAYNYKPDMSTLRGTLAGIAWLNQTDPAKASEQLATVQSLMLDSASPYYSPYSVASNQKALSALSGILGENLTGGVDKAWLERNKALMGGARYTTTGESPAAPTKTSTPQENAAYWYYQLCKDEDNTAKAEKEWQALQKEIAWYAGSDASYSDQEILERIDWSKYGTLRGMDDAKGLGVPTGLNRPVGYSQDALYGAVYAARNPDSASGNALTDAISYALGTGKKYVPDAAAVAARDPGSPQYNPYKRGNADDVYRYFGVAEINRDTLESLRPMLSDGKPETQKMFARAYDAVENADRATEQLQALRAQIDVELRYSNDPDKVLSYLRYAEDGKTSRSEYSTLWKMDDARRQGGKIALGYAVDYRWEDIEAYVRQQTKVQQEALDAAKIAAENKEKEHQRDRDMVALAVGQNPDGTPVAKQPIATERDVLQADVVINPVPEAVKSPETGTGMAELSDAEKQRQQERDMVAMMIGQNPDGSLMASREEIEINAQYEALAGVVTAFAASYTPEEMRTFAQATGGHVVEAAQYEKDLWQTIKETVVGTDNVPVFTESDRKNLEFMEQQLAADPGNALAEYWTGEIARLGQKRDKYAAAYGQNPTYQDTIQAMYANGEHKAVVDLLTSGLHIHTRYTYSEINDYLLLALSKETTESLLESGAIQGKTQAAIVEDMRDAIARLYARPVPEAKADGWLQSAAQTIVDALNGKGTYERSALNEGLDLQTLGTQATNSMFSMAGKSMMGIAKMAGAPVKLGFEAAGNAEAYQKIEDELINDALRLETERLQASAEFLAKYGTGGDLLLYQISRDLGKAVLDLGAASGVTASLAYAGASSRLAKLAGRLVYAGQAAGSSAAEASLLEDVGTLQWLGAGMANGVISYGVMALGVEDRVLGRLANSNNPQTVQQIMNMGAHKYVLQYGKPAFNFIKTVITGAAGEYAEEFLEQAIGDPITDLITGQEMKSVREYAGQSHRAGLSGALIGGLLSGITFSAAAPLDAESHKMLVKLTEDADVGREVTVGQLLGFMEMVEADMQNPAIRDGVVEQAAAYAVSERVVEKVAEGALDTVAEAPEVKAAQVAADNLANAEAELEKARAETQRARENLDAARRAIVELPTNENKVAHREAAQNYTAAAKAKLAAQDARDKAYEASLTAREQAEAASMGAMQSLRAEAAHDVVTSGHEAQERVEQDAQQQVNPESAPVANADTDAQAESGGIPSDENVQLLRRGENAEQARPTDAQAKKEVRNPVQIVRKLAERLGVGASVGTKKMTPGGKALPPDVLGYYERRSGNMAQRHATDYAAGMHELGHALAQTTDMAGTPEMVARLDAVFGKNYDAKALPGEAFAEFVRLYMTDTAAAERFAGTDFFRQFEAKLREKKAFADVQEAREALQGYLNASFAERVGSMQVDKARPNPDKQGIGERIRERVRGWTTSMLDWTRPAEDVDKRVREQTGEYQAAENSLREAALWHNARDTRAAGQITNKLTDSHGRIIGDSLADVMQESGVRGEDFDLFNTYLLVKHSFDRDRQGKPVYGEQFTAEQRRQFVAETEAAHPEFVRGSQAFQAWWGQFMQAWMVDTGFLSQESFDAMRAMYPNYVPTMRYIPGKAGRGMGQKFSVKSAVGSDLEIFTPFDSVVDMVNSVVKTVSRNNIGVVWDQLYQETDGLGIFGREITEDQRRETASLDGVKRDLRALLADKLSEGDMDAVLSALGDFASQWTGTGNSSEPGTLVVTRPDGTQVYYEIYDRALYDMFASAGETAAKTGLEFIGRFTRAMTMLTTGNHPIFALTNALRDYQKSVNYGSWASNYVTGLPKWISAFWQVWRNGGEYEQYVAMGGGGWNRIGSQTKKSAASYRGDMFKGYDSSTAGRTVKLIGEKIWSALTLSRLNEIVENTSRYAEYRYGQHDLTTDSGRLEAFRAAQEATVDFSRKGDSAAARTLRHVIPFFNATAQGGYQAGRMFTGTERQRLGARFAKTVVNTALATALAAGMRIKFGNEDEEEMYNLLSADIRNGYLIIPNPFDAERRFIRIPVSQDPLAKAVHGLVSSLISSDDPLGQDLMLVAGSVLDGMNPAGSTIFNALIEVATNESWYGGNIVPGSLERLPATQQYDETTANAFIAAGRVTGMSPKKLQYLADQYTGWIGDLAIPALSKDRYTGELGGLPSVLRNFSNRLTIDPAYTNDVVDAFYQDKNALEQIVAATKKDRPADVLRGNLTEAERKQAYEDAYALTHSGGAFADAADRVSDLWAEIDDIQAKEGLTQKQKNLLAKDVRMEMIRVMLGAEEAKLTFDEKYVTGRSVFAFALQGGPTLTIASALERMPGVFAADLEAGSEYMQRARSVWEETGEDSALPHPNDGFTKDKVEYVIPAEYRDEWDARYRDAYRRAVEVAGRKWDDMTPEERLEALKAAHGKGHAAAKEWWMREHRELGMGE